MLVRSYITSRSQRDVAPTRTTFTLDDELAARARHLGISISAAARARRDRGSGRARETGSDRAYERRPERVDPFWNDAEAWVEG